MPARKAKSESMVGREEYGVTILKVRLLRGSLVLSPAKVHIDLNRSSNTCDDIQQRAGSAVRHGYGYAPEAP